ncbi:MAG: hypothetical protein HYZ87_00665 [Candidatus Omnitrophica bacterium]|nr:hypothetical protein [Candidatus Omnitrophota bacterium]
MVHKRLTKKKMLVAASVAGLLAVSGLAGSANTVYAEDVHCSGVNACKGTGECGGKGHACAGKNACKGQGWIKTASAEACKTMGGMIVA